MSVTLWRIAGETRSYGADDLSGRGAELTGGRWNRAGRPLVYTSSSISLACLETVVHLNADGLPLKRFLVAIEVPDDVWAARRVFAVEELPAHWDDMPATRPSLDVGDGWLREGATALLIVPSVIVPEEFNVLVNPKHADAARLAASKRRRWTYDARLLAA